MYQDTLLLIFLDLRKFHNNLDWGRILKTIEGYGAGHKLWVLLSKKIATGGNHSQELLPWPSVPSDQRDDTGGTGIAYNIQCGSGNSGTSLAITYIGG